MSADCAYIPVHDFVTVEILQAETKLPEVLSRLLKREGRLGVLGCGAHGHSHQYSARHVFKNHVQSVCVWYRDSLVQVHDLELVSSLWHHINVTRVGMT